MLRQHKVLVGATAFGLAVLVANVGAQVGRGSTEWLTAGGDAQRTFWVRTDPKISPASVAQPGFELQWSRKLDNRLRGTNGLLHGVTANGVTLFVPMSIVAGSSNNVYALDNDTGYVVWQRKFDAALPAATAQCPGGITAGPTRIVTLEPPPITLALAGIEAPGGGRAGQSYRSVIGEPGQGVPLEGRGGRAGGGAPATPAGQAGLGQGAQQPAGGARGAGAPGAPPAGTPAPAAGAAPGGGGGQGRGAQAPGIPGATAEQIGGGGGLGRASGVVYALSSDGVLHVMGLPSGKDIQRPAEFIPSNARWTDTIAVNTTLYATTSGNCGGAPNAIWGIDLASESKPVVSWKSNGGPIVGRVAFTTDGTLLAAIGPGTVTGDGKVNAIVALDPKTLQLKDWYTKAGTEFVTGPTVFKHGEQEVVAAGTKDGRVVLLSAASLGGSDHGTALHASSPVTAAGGSIAGGQLATWQELTVTAPPPPPPAPAGAAAAPPQGGGGRGQAAAAPIVTTGARWIVVPTSAGLTTLKVAGNGASLTLERGWTATVASPATPIVVNGVVFALAPGRAAVPAVLHAFDGVSGKQLWTSGKAMKTAAAAGSFWSALSQVYVGGTDGTLHAFGFLDERR